MRNALANPRADETLREMGLSPTRPAKVKGFIDLLEGRSTAEVTRHSEIDTHTRMLKFVKLSPTKLAA